MSTLLPLIVVLDLTRSIVHKITATSSQFHLINGMNPTTIMVKESRDDISICLKSADKVSAAVRLRSSCAA